MALPVPSVIWLCGWPALEPWDLGVKGKLNSCAVPECSSMDGGSEVPPQVGLPKHILDIWVIVLIILATIVIMTSLLLCPATAVIIYRMRTHPVLNGAV
ncbi:small integral membrane protein 3 isoform X1 [Myotis yumanensis]|uniref:small integral membrane protein 3 isoform X1 n=2 Tax=Myotis yumanensis TaxID=159337 RepID=UPI0038D1686E